MNSTTKKQFTATIDYLQQYSQHITHVAVAHTCYKTFGLNEKKMQEFVDLAKKDCRYFRNCLNKELFGGNLSRRKPRLYQPLIISTLEGSLVNNDRNLTLHYNFSFGNLPKEITDEEFHKKFRDCWVKKANQSDNIWHDVINGDVSKANGWLGYSMKEAETRGNLLVWDVENTQIPHEAFNAD